MFGLYAYLGNVLVWECKELKLFSLIDFVYSILKVSSILESRLKFRSTSHKLLQNTETLHDAIKILKNTGFRLAKFCHVDLLLQVYVSICCFCMDACFNVSDTESFLGFAIFLSNLQH
jgi:hypothetical protein